MINLPNLITIGRILLVPLTVWLIISEAYGLAFLSFVAAGVSDGIDGYLARHYNLRTELGAYLDPLADKALLVSIYVTLGLTKDIPAWLVIAVVSRDVLIVGAFMLSWLMDKPVRMAPLMVSKVNTAVQIIFAGAVLARSGDSATDLMPMHRLGQPDRRVLTVASGGALHAWTGCATWPMAMRRRTAHDSAAASDASGWWRSAS